MKDALGLEERVAIDARRKLIFDGFSLLLAGATRTSLMECEQRIRGLRDAYGDYRTTLILENWFL